MSAQEEVSEFVVRIPKRNSRKTHHVMKFNASLHIDFTKWAQGTVRMVRENNQKNVKSYNGSDMPKFGAGSEFGREQKEEARRKKYGYNAKKYRPEDQPWLIRVGDKKTGKRYRGIREGGVAENTTYYVFTHAQDGAFEAHPIGDWYNFTPIQTYKTLNDEEAEEKFAKRGKILNHWALMVNKKIRSAQDEDEDLDDEGKTSKKNNKKDNSFKISDMDDWVNSGDELESDSDDEEKKKKKEDSDDESNKKKKGKDSKKKKKRSKEDVQNEAFEDSDDGDDECREVDYMSDESSESEAEAMEKNNAKGVDQDQGLARMLDSESSSDEEENKKKSDKEDEADDDNDEEGGSKKDKKKKKDKKGKQKEGGKQSANSSRSSSPTPGDKQTKAEKRKALIDNILDPNEPTVKKTRLEQFGSSSSSLATPISGSEAALEDDVRRYLTRKPMTTTELVKKIHSKRFQDLNKEELMPLLVNVLKKVNPHKSKTKGIMYLSLKPDK